jgi:ribulose 1,5-bisphosphate synthetase/thiazole synthase
MYKRTKLILFRITTFIIYGAILSNITGCNKISKFTEITDVLVVGGGTSGVIAAIQSARLGCKTTLIESGSQLGGTMTTGGVVFPGLFHAWGEQVIKGIGWSWYLKP